MIDVAGFVNRPQFIWFQCFVVVQLYQNSRLQAPLTANGKFEILLVKMFILKQKLNQILPERKSNFAS